MNLLRRLLAYLFASPGGVREDQVGQDEALLSALASDVSDPDGYERLVFLMSAEPKAGA
ncbi:MAG: hypothetical protein K0Q93_3025 [Nocardioidaceae bacterium]|jgi:hypothetical protein|nr:hypothetical protein [Nocardioidaceae bacterium]